MITNLRIVILEFFQHITLCLGKSDFKFHALLECFSIEMFDLNVDFRVDFYIQSFNNQISISFHDSDVKIDT